MVVLVIDFVGIAFFESKGDPPVTRDPDRPHSRALPHKLMKKQPWQIHVPRSGRYLKATENQPYASFMLSLDASTRSSLGESLESFVAESPNHLTIVTRNPPGVDTIPPLPNGLSSAAPLGGTLKLKMDGSSLPGWLTARARAASAEVAGYVPSPEPCFRALPFHIGNTSLSRKGSSSRNA